MPFPTDRTTVVTVEGSAVRHLGLRDAKAGLSSVVDEAVRGQPTVITRHGQPEAVIVGYAEWERLSRVPSFAQLLLSAPADLTEFVERAPGAPRDVGF